MQGVGQMANCERCLKPEAEVGKLETFSYRVVCQEGTINMDVKYCSKCCDELENEVKEEEHE
jgi:hypothetical protein